MRASWSLALKSAAVSDANAVGSKAGASPTVATICPVRSTIRAVRALDSARKPLRITWIRLASSSRKDQLEAPFTGETSYEGGFHTPHNGLRPPPEHRLPLPGQVVSQQPDGVHTILPGQKPQRCKAPQRSGAEKVTPVIAEALLPQKPARGRPGHEPSDEKPATRAHQPTSCRATRACARVTPSTYSRSPPMGSPRARRVTRTS